MQHLPLPMGEVPPQGAERAINKPSPSKIKDFCQLSQRESQVSTAPKPPSDEGGGSKSRRERILPLSHAVRVTAPLTRGAVGAPAPGRGTYMQSEV